MIARAGKGDPTPSGSMQYIPASTDDHAIIALPIIGLTYSPLVRLDEDVIRAVSANRPKSWPRDGVHWAVSGAFARSVPAGQRQVDPDHLLPADYAQWRAQYQPPSGNSSAAGTKRRRHPSTCLDLRPAAIRLPVSLPVRSRRSRLNVRSFSSSRSRERAWERGINRAFT